MNSLVSVREFARLTTAEIQPTLDQATVPASAFEWLCEESARLRSSSGAALVQLSDRRELRIDNYVGVIETPCGTRLEILPKHVDDHEGVTESRRLLRRMLLRSLDLPRRETAPSDIESFDGPLTEWIIGRFLSELDRLVKRGIRFEYHRVEEEQRFLRGRLDVPRQIRQPPGRQHLFQIQHDVFEPNRPENRLLHSALDRVRRRAQLPANWRLAHELASYLAPVPYSADVSRDFRAWKADRLTAHYQAVRPWCSLILDEQVPLSIAGGWRGPSFLFPMERVFERYVASCLREALLPGAKLVCTPSHEHLCRHRDSEWFGLEPDMLIESGAERWVLDAKWKRVNAALANTRDKYDLSRDDFFQMFAYGQRYLHGAGDLVLIYPKTADFSEALPPFQFSERLRLSVVPFDLEKSMLSPGVAELPIRGRVSRANVVNGSTAKFVA